MISGFGDRLFENFRFVSDLLTFALAVAAASFCDAGAKDIAKNAARGELTATKAGGEPPETPKINSELYASTPFPSD